MNYYSLYSVVYAYFYCYYHFDYYLHFMVKLNSNLMMKTWKLIYRLPTCRSLLCRRGIPTFPDHDSHLFTIHPRNESDSGWSALRTRAFRRLHSFHRRLFHLAISFFLIHSCCSSIRQVSRLIGILLFKVR